MSEERVVQASINVARSEVMLRGTQTQPALRLHDTFDVQKGDTLKWVVSGAPPASKVRIRFVRFPDKDQVSLFTDGRNVLEAGTGVIASGSVAPEAFAGCYSYLVELVEGDKVTNLTCFWTNGSAQDSTVMGGGVQSGGPPAPRPAG